MYGTVLVCARKRLPAGGRKVHLSRAERTCQYSLRVFSLQDVFACSQNMSRLFCVAAWTHPPSPISLAAHKQQLYRWNRCRPVFPLSSNIIPTRQEIQQCVAHQSRLPNARPYTLRVLFIARRRVYGGGAFRLSLFLGRQRGSENAGIAAGAVEQDEGARSLAACEAKAAVFWGGVVANVAVLYLEEALYRLLAPSPC